MANGHDTLTITLYFHENNLSKGEFRRGVGIMAGYLNPAITEPQLRRLACDSVKYRKGDEWEDVEELVYSE